MADAERSILETINKCKIGYIGHVLCRPKYEILKLIIQEKIEDGHRGPKTKQMFWLRNIRQWTELGTVQELMKGAENREI